MKKPQKKQVMLEELVPPLHWCKLIPNGEFWNSALCWRTFNKGRKDEYTIVFPTGTIDPHDDDVPAPTCQEILEALDEITANPTLWKNPACWTADCDFSGKSASNWDVREKRSKENPALALLRLWLEAKGIKEI